MVDLLDRFAPLMAQRDALFSDGGVDPFQVEMDEVLSQTEAVIEGRRTIITILDLHSPPKRLMPLMPRLMPTEQEQQGAASPMAHTAAIKS
jgi:hypothetical protein